MQDTVNVTNTSETTKIGFTYSFTRGSKFPIHKRRSSLVVMSSLLSLSWKIKTYKLLLQFKQTKIYLRRFRYSLQNSVQCGP